MKSKKIHMIGIGGIGMSGLAHILRAQGAIISGSDIEDNDILKKLRKKNITVHIGHNKGNVKNPDYVVYSSSIKPNNPELQAAKKTKASILPRVELLKMITEQNKQIVAIAGTHGKTTITAMISVILEKAKLDPTFLIGGESLNFGTNAKLGKGSLIVTETDESDGMFVMLNPTHIIMPNLEREHLEHYKDENDLIGTFKKFIKRQKRDAIFFYRIEDTSLRKLAECHPGKKFSFGFSREANLYADNVRTKPFQTEFDSFLKGVPIGRFRLNIPGVHNVINALGAISVAIAFGVDVNVIKKALSEYKGVKRRFEVVGHVNGAKIVEDYAHHPTEIKATIMAARSLSPKRIITVFQPHRYSRTKHFYKEFSESFSGSSEVILTEIYAASENKIEGVSIKGIYDLMIKNESIPVRIIDKNKIPDYLKLKIDKGDIVLVLGAGDINKVAHKMVAV